MMHNKSQSNNFNSIRCVKCGSTNVIRDDESEKDNYICQDCGTNFDDKSRLGKSFNNVPQIVVGKRTEKFLKFLFIVIIVVGIWYYFHLKGLKNEKGTYYPYSIIHGKETTKEIFDIGEELYCENKSFKVNSVNYPKKVNGKNPSKGNKFISLNITVKNTISKSKFYSASDLKILLSDNTEIGKIFYSTFPSNRIDGGKSASGVVSFEIPNNESQPVLNYYCDYWIDEMITKVKLTK